MSRLYRLRKNNKGGNERGFTLIELLVVIAIIGVLSSVVMVNLADARQKADDSKRLQDMEQVKNAAELYASKHGGSYPDISEATLMNRHFAEVKKPASGLLSFFATPAEAASHSDLACERFDALAEALVADGDISSEPVDPHDASSVTCYKALANTESDFLVAYTYLWQKYKNTSAGASSPSNKQVGFIVTKHSDLTREKIGEVCAATRSAYGDGYAYPVINPYSQNTICDTSRLDGLVADALLGITGGDETIVTNDSLSSNGASCTLWSDCQSGICNSGICSSSNGNLGNGSSCSFNTDCLSSYCNAGICEDLTNGTCSDPAYTNSSDCGSHGICSNSTYTDEASCTSIGYCSNGSYTDQTTCVGDGGGYCSSGSYGNASDCTSNGYCSNGSNTDQNSCQNSGYCSNSGYYDMASCTTSGYCSNNYSSDAYSCDSGWWYSGSWYSNNYSWSANTWTSNNTGNSWTANTWTSDVWTSN